MAREDEGQELGSELPAENSNMQDVATLQDGGEDAAESQDTQAALSTEADDWKTKLAESFSGEVAGEEEAQHAAESEEKSEDKKPEEELKLKGRAKEQFEKLTTHNKELKTQLDEAQPFAEVGKRLHNALETYGVDAGEVDKVLAASIEFYSPNTDDSRRKELARMFREMAAEADGLPAIPGQKLELPPALQKRVDRGELSEDEAQELYAELRPSTPTKPKKPEAVKPPADANQPTETHHKIVSEWDARIEKEFGKEAHAVASRELKTLAAKYGYSFDRDPTGAIAKNLLDDAFERVSQIYKKPADPAPSPDPVLSPKSRGQANKSSGGKGWKESLASEWSGR